MPVKYCDDVRGAHDMPHQGNIRHSTGTGNIYQQLERLDREEARLQKQYVMWTARARRIEGRMAQINGQRSSLLATLEPAIHAAEREVGLR